MYDSYLMPKLNSCCYKIFYIQLKILVFIFLQYIPTKKPYILQSKQ